MTKLSRVTLSLSFGTLLTGSAMTAGIVYTEDFVNSGVASAALDTVGWTASYNAGGGTTAYDTDDPVLIGSLDVPFLAAAAGAEATGNPPGYLFHGVGLPAAPTLWYEEGLASGNFSDLQTVSFALGNNLTTDDIRIALQTGSSWYVSEDVFSVETAFNTFAPNWETFSADFASLTWNDLNSDLSRDLTTVTPTGAVTGFGFFANTDSQPIRFDSVQLTAVPEPSTYAALSFGMILGLMVLRRRMKAKKA